MSSSYSDFYKVTDLELTSIADAIRNTGGISESLTFPLDFIDSIDNISNKDKIFLDTITGTISGTINCSASKIQWATFAYCSLLTEASFPNCTSIEYSVFENCTSLSSINFPECTYIGGSAFKSCYSLSEVNFPKCSSINMYAFDNCTSLVNVSFPECIILSTYAFVRCAALSTINLPKCINVGMGAFSQCTMLQEVNLPICSILSHSAFYKCFHLLSLYLTSASLVVTLNNVSVFYSTPISNYTTYTGQYGSIFVPASLYSSFISATNWTYFKSRIVSV